MNKKIIITIATITVLAVGSLIGYNVYQNSKQEVPQKAVEITSTDKVVENDKEKPASTEQKKEVEVILDAEQAQVVFQNLHQAITNIDYKDAEQVKKQEEIIKATTHPALTDIILKKFNYDGKENPYKAELQSLNINEIKNTSYELKDKKFKGFEIVYDYVVKDDEGEHKIINQYSIVVLDTDNNYKVMGYNVPKK